MIDSLAPRVEILGKKRWRGGWVVVLLGALCALGPVGCSSSSTGPDAGPVETKLTPVPAPDGLLASAFAPTPDATWARARAAIGGPSAFFPQSFGGLAATALGLPITVAGEIDGDVPALAALGSPLPDGKLRTVAGIHVKVGDRFLDQITRGEAARFTATVDPTTHISLLAAKTGGQGSVVMGMLGNYLLISTKKEDLLALGPYVARTMPTLPAPKEDVVIEASPNALAGAEIARLKSSWNALKEQAKSVQAPVLLASRVDGLFDVLGDVAQAKATITLAEGVVRVRAAVVPKSGGGAATKAAAALGIGDAKPLLDLPSKAQIALYLRSPASGDAADPSAELATTVAGKDASEADKEAIAAAFRSARAVTGAYATLGIALLPTGPIAFGRAPVTDEAAATKAITDVTALLKLPSFKARLEESHVSASSGKTVVENLPGDVQRIRIGRKDEKDGGKEKKAETRPDKKGASDKPAAPSESPSHIDMLWLVQNGFAIAAVGTDPKDALRAIAKSAPEQSLGADPNVRAAIEGLGNNVAFAFFADVPRVVAARVGKPAPPTSAPVVFSFGKATTSSELEARLDIANGALQDLIRNRGAF